MLGLGACQLRDCCCVPLPLGMQLVSSGREVPLAHNRLIASTVLLEGRLPVRSLQSEPFPADVRNEATYRPPKA